MERNPQCLRVVSEEGNEKMDVGEERVIFEVVELVPAKKGVLGTNPGVVIWFSSSSSS